MNLIQNYISFSMDASGAKLDYNSVSFVKNEFNIPIGLMEWMITISNNTVMDEKELLGSFGYKSLI